MSMFKVTPWEQAIVLDDLTGMIQAKILIFFQGIQKRIFDIGSTLGLSNTVMRLIEKRGTQV